MTTITEADNDWSTASLAIYAFFLIGTVTFLYLLFGKAFEFLFLQNHSHSFGFF
jgi:hypothetical protein